MLGLRNWTASTAATVASTYALDACATAAGVGLVASGLLGGLGHRWALAFLVVSYALWAWGLRANLRANWTLLATTGISTNVLSKMAYDLTRRATTSVRATRVAAATGYAGTEIAKEVPYYAGAFGVAIVSDSIGSTEAVVFLGGANIGAALYEYGLARLTRVFLRRRRGYASFDTDWVPAEYLSGYYRTVEPDEIATIAFFVDAMRDAERDRPVLFFGVGPTMHHVFAAAEVASEIHLGDYLPANLAEIRRWLDREPGAHDWRPFVRYTLQCEGIVSPTDAEMTAREDLTRKKITELIQVDGRHSPPVDRQYSTVISAYCADSATGDRVTWEPFMRNITELVRPGGLFVGAALRRCRHYRVADKLFPSADVDERDVRAVLRPGFEAADATIEVRQVALGATHGYTAIVLCRARRRPPDQGSTSELALVGSEISVPLVDGGERRYVNLDYAASAPCLASVKQAVDELLPWYSSVHRGAGYKSQLVTDAYEGAREAVRAFVGGRGDDVVVFTRNTTDATNVLASALPPGTEVIAFAAEHHANLLPWRRRHLTLLPLPAGPDEAVDLLERALSTPAPSRNRLVTVTGASNVTGEIWPYAEMARVAHLYGARLMLDAAQLAPHRRIDMAADGIDYLALSGHKLYAPFGAGALAGRRDWLGAGEPFLAGGGAVRYVGTDTVLWADLPDRQEAGSPNVVGAVALGVACRTVQAADRDCLEAYETRLADHARDRLLAVPGVEVYRLWAIDHPRIAVLPFALAGVPYARLAAILSAEFGIGVRHGCFCAHPLMTALLQIDAAHDARIRDSLARREPVAIPGAVRASAGIGTTAADYDRLTAAVAEIAAHGPRWTYASSADGTDCRPVPDPRPRPKLPFDLGGSLVT
jgi:selenocysteine lyase/cysteine desulfurase